MTYSNRLLQASRLLRSLSNRQRRGFTLIELLVVVVIIGILASVALPSFVGAQDKARNASVAANVNSIRMALEQYAVDFNGSYPSQNNFPRSLSTGGYLPGNRMPKSPWASFIQTQNVAILTPMLSANALVTQPLPSLGSVIGGGQVPQGGNFANARNYGAIMYDYDVNSQIYVVYGTGKKARQAILGGATSNGSN